MASTLTADASAAFRFLGSSDTARLIASRDWSDTSIGPIETWPQSLKTTVSIMMHTPVPMVLLWNEDGVMLYNDAYSMFAGGRHPQLLGSKVREGWPEVADWNDNVMNVGLAGGTLSYRDQELTLYRHGHAEQVFMDLDYSPVVDVSGRVAGVLCVLAETTERVMSERQFHSAEEKLRQASQRLTAILDNTREAVFLMDHRQQCVFANAAAEKLSGYSFAQMHGRPLHEIVHHTRPDGSHYPLEECPIDRALPTRAQVSGEELFVAPDGSFYPVWFTASPIIDDEGQPVGTVIEVRNIAEEKARDEALREETKALATLNRTGAAVAAELDLERVVQLVTDAGVELTGAQFGAFFYNVIDNAGGSYMLYTLSGAPREAFENFGMPRATPVFKPTFVGEGVIRSDDIRKDPRYGQMAPHHGMPKGHLPVCSYLAVPVTSRSGEVVGGLFFGHPEPGQFSERHEQLMVGVASQAAVAIDNARLYQAAQKANETLERRVNEALAERKLLAEIVETTDAIVQIVDPEFTILGVNRAAADEFERVYGVRPKAGDKKSELLKDHPSYKQIVEPLWQRALSGEDFTEVLEMSTADGPRSYEIRFNSLRGPDGELIGAYQFAHDVTERLNDQRRLADAEDALRQSQKMEAVGQLVSGMAHDFNNLLGAVIGSLDLIRRRPDDRERVQRFAEAGLQAAERGSKLTSQLLAFSRSQRIELRPIFVCDVVEDVRDLLARTLGPMIDLEFALNPHPVPVLADATQVEMTVLNLALNARDAMPDGGKLTIATARRTITDDAELPDGEYVELSVADTGEGMDAETLRRAMDPFFTTKPLGKGTGLGLAQVYGAARQAQGTVRLESKPGRGTTVRVLLPRTDEICDTGDAAGEGAGADQPQGGRILVIDDDADLRGIIVNSLELLGYEVMSAADGPSGLALLETTPPTAMVVDFAMPGMSGADVAAEARKKFPDLPIVLASGYADSEAIDRAIGAEAKVLRKPFRVDELLAAVTEAIQARQPA